MTREQLNQSKQLEIINEQRHQRRKKITLFIFKVSFFLILGFLFFYLYTTFISTSKVIIKEQRIINKKLPSNFDGLKLIHFSDLHYGTTIFDDELEKLVKKINLRKPDIVVFTGDLIDDKYELKTNEQENIITILKKIDARLGKYAVFGEQDGESFQTIMKQSDFNILHNSYDLIYNNNNQPILLVGLGNNLTNTLNIDEGFSYFGDVNYDSNIFTISLVHEPDIIDSILAKYSSDLILAGHSHNGNVRIPYIGALHKYDGANKYDQSYYRVDNSDLYVSSGIGTNGPGFRLFCRPSINFFRISSK